MGPVSRYKLGDVVVPTHFSGKGIPHVVHGIIAKSYNPEKYTANELYLIRQGGKQRNRIYEQLVVPEAEWELIKNTQGVS